MKADVLVAGVGNVFLSDDGFGVEVVTRLLAQGGLPDGVEVADIGIRGMHLAYQLLDGYRVLLLVDTAQRGGDPGTLYLLEHDLTDRAPRDEAAASFNAHGMDPASVLAMLDSLAGAVDAARPLERVLVVGCEPAVLDEGMGLSPPVAGAVDRAVQAVTEIVGDLLRNKSELPTTEGEHDVRKADFRSAPGGGRRDGAVLAAGHSEVPGNSGHVSGTTR